MKKFFSFVALASSFIFFTASCGPGWSQQAADAYWDAFNLNKRATESVGETRSQLIEKLGPPTSSKSKDGNVEILTFYKESQAWDLTGEYTGQKRYCTTHVTLRNDTVESVEKGPCRLHH